MWCGFPRRTATGVSVEALRTEEAGNVPSSQFRCAAGSTAALEDAILKAGPENVAAFIAEPVGGSSTGASVPPPEYFRRVRDMCDKYQVLFIADEVLAGAGRTGTWSAIEPYGVMPDIQMLGKGITGGYAPLSGRACTDQAPRSDRERLRRLLHAQTFSHHAVLCATGLAAVRYIRQHGLVAAVRQDGPGFPSEAASAARSPPRGRRARTGPAGWRRVRRGQEQPRPPFPGKRNSPSDSPMPRWRKV